MLFTSGEFILFLVLTVFLYYIVPKKYQWIMLLLANAVFYMAAGVEGFLYIGATILSTYFISLRIDLINSNEKEQVKKNKGVWSREDKKIFKEKMKKKRGRWLITGIVFNFGILAVLKYANFVITNVNNIFFGGEEKLQLVELFIPLGISFYTFQIMGYLIDLYYGKYNAQRNIFKLALFTSFFPQLIQGPISRFGQLSETLFDRHPLVWSNIRLGLERVLWGYFKKLVIADRMLVAVKALIGDTVQYNGTYAFVGMIFYAAQLYADFTGGIDITIGIGQMLGIKVTENFHRPFFSKDIAEYWRRWHISLGVWFKEYIFYPISISGWMMKLTKKSKKIFGDGFGKKIPVYIASLITWFVTGLWHGAAWNFIVWGLGNCIIILISEELKPLYAKFHAKFPKLKPTTAYKIFEILRTFFIMCSLRMLDCYRDVIITVKMWFSMFTDFHISEITNGELLNLGLTAYDYIVLAVGILMMFFVSMLQRREAVRKRISKRGFVFECTVFALLFIIIIIYGAYGIGYDASQFIYNQF
ncbi:MAG: MBOAT family protein [Lachnospiraceae bacterium]|nr:MBOAT family protein [Lachnospiraceae bacterium]